jgi:hypothetical protein
LQCLLKILVIIIGLCTDLFANKETYQTCCLLGF